MLKTPTFHPSEKGTFGEEPGRRLQPRIDVNHDGAVPIDGDVDTEQATETPPCQPCGYTLGCRGRGSQLDTWKIGRGGEIIPTVTESDEARCPGAQQAGSILAG